MERVGGRIGGGTREGRTLSLRPSGGYEAWLGCTGNSAVTPTMGERAKRGCRRCIGMVETDGCYRRAANFPALDSHRSIASDRRPTSSSALHIMQNLAFFVAMCIAGASGFTPSVFDSRPSTVRKGNGQPNERSIPRPRSTEVFRPQKPPSRR